MEKVGLEPRTLGYQALRSANCARSPVVAVRTGRGTSCVTYALEHSTNFSQSNGRVRPPEGSVQAGTVAAVSRAILKLRFSQSASAALRIRTSRSGPLESAHLSRPAMGSGCANGITRLGSWCLRNLQTAWDSDLNHPDPHLSWLSILCRDATEQ